MTLVEWLIRTDKQCFIFIQTHLAGPYADPVMLVIRNPLTWIPVYMFMLYWILKNDRKQAVQFILLSVITVSITDYTASEWLKPLFGRLRPCYDPDTLPYLRGLISCGGQFSFPSNHATNHFGLATFWFGAIWRIKGKRWYWLWAWAFLICAGQVYVGKHFPLDILAGSLYGITIGMGSVWLFRNWVSIQSKTSRRLGLKKTSPRTPCKGLPTGRLQADQP
jgi:membrane-associated phospholipid phosphatase